MTSPSAWCLEVRVSTARAESGSRVMLDRALRVLTKCDAGGGSVLPLAVMGRVDGCRAHVVQGQPAQHVAPWRPAVRITITREPRRDSDSRDVFRVELRGLVFKSAPYQLQLTDRAALRFANGSVVDASDVGDTMLLAILAPLLEPVHLVAVYKYLPRVNYVGQQVIATSEAAAASPEYRAQRADHYRAVCGAMPNHVIPFDSVTSDPLAWVHVHFAARGDGQDEEGEEVCADGAAVAPRDDEEPRCWQRFVRPWEDLLAFAEFVDVLASPPRHREGVGHIVQRAHDVLLAALASEESFQVLPSDSVEERAVFGFQPASSLRCTAEPFVQEVVVLNHQRDPAALTLPVTEAKESGLVAPKPLPKAAAQRKGRAGKKCA